MTVELYCSCVQRYTLRAESLVRSQVFMIGVCFLSEKLLSSTYIFYTVDTSPNSLIAATVPAP